MPQLLGIYVPCNILSLPTLVSIGIQDMSNTSSSNTAIYEAVKNALEGANKDCSTLLPSTTGESIYDIAVKHGYVGTEKEWLNYVSEDLELGNVLHSKVSELTALVNNIPTTVNDAINNTAIEGGVLADTLVTMTAKGVGAVARNLRGVNSDTVSVKDFGAKGDGSTDDTASIKAAIAYAASVGGGLVNVPVGTYRTSATIEIPANVTLQGANRSASVISGLSRDFEGLKFMSNSSELSQLFIRGMAVGVVGSKAARYCKLDNCVISYNRIGIDWEDGYINTISRNNVTFNTYGGVIRGQSFQQNIYDNVIDNNLGGLGLLVIGSSGCVIRDNTIEGNRLVATGQGVGLAIFGSPQRVVVDSNWFEVNGTALVPDSTTVNEYGCDILLGDGITPVATEIINKCFPEEHRASCLGALSTTGNIHLKNNFHFMTKHGVMTRLQSSPVNLKIHDMTYNGVATNGQKAISIEYVSGVLPSMAVDIRSASVAVTATSNNSALLTGIAGSYVHCNKVTALNLVKVDGVDLYTKRLSCADFLALPNASLSVTAAAPTTGTATRKNLFRAQQGVKGLTTSSVSSFGRLELTPPPFVVGDAYSVIMLSKPKSTFVIYRGGSPATISSNDNGIANLFRIENNSVQSSSKLYFNEGEFYGHCIMTKAQADVHLKGAARLELIDLSIVTDKQYSSSKPSDARIHANVGDIVHNSAPTVGTAYSWVCTVEGAPGTWEPTSNIGTS